MLKRFWEIDSLRGIAILLMVIFHILFDLDFFGLYRIDFSYLPMRIFNYSIGTLFLVLVGISLTLSFMKAQNTLSQADLRRKFLIRGLKILGRGFVATLVTWAYLGRGVILFGVLHCIGVSILLGYLFIQQRLSPLVLGVFCIITGLILRGFRFDFPYLLWLGFIPTNFYTLDYFPLLPWFGVVLIGIMIGNTVYPQLHPIIQLPDLSKKKIILLLQFLGRHSLVIYLLHQLIIVGVIQILLLF